VKRDFDRPADPAHPANTVHDEYRDAASGVANADRDRSYREFFDAAPESARAELAKLSDRDLWWLYEADGPPPSRIYEVASIEGFADFARTSRAGARIVTDAVGMYAEARSNLEIAVRSAKARGGSAREGFDAAAAMYRDVVPTVRPHPTMPGYRVIERASATPSWIPAVTLHPSRALDWNGAFSDGVAPQMRSPRPDQLIVDGKPLTTLDGVLELRAHGSPTGFGELSTEQAAKLVAGEIAYARARGTAIDKVLLTSCHQRDWRWRQGSNASRFQQLLAGELARTGQAPVDVLAARKPGPLYTDYRMAKTFKEGWVPASFTPASDPARPYVDRDTARRGLVAGGVAASVLAAELYFVLKAR
jgi:hypothetical protein